MLALIYFPSSATAEMNCWPADGCFIILTPDGPTMGDDDDDDDDDEGGGGFAFPDETVDESGFISQPQMCDKVTIHYARAAKKVDVQLLKESIWSRMEKDGMGERAEGQPLSDSANKENTKKGTQDENELPPGGRELDFNHVMQKFPTQVPKQKQEMLKDVSVSYCFICLLHLANEVSGWQPIAAFSLSLSDFYYRLSFSMGHSHYTSRHHRSTTWF